MGGGSAIAGCHRGVRFLVAIVGCHGGVPFLGAMVELLGWHGAMVG